MPARRPPAPDALGRAAFAAGRNWAITSINAKAAELLGIPLRGARGASLWEAVPGFARTAFESGCRRAAEKQTVEVEAWHAPSRRYLALRAGPWRGGIAATLVDVTARVATERRLRVCCDVSRALASADSPAEAAAPLVRALCEGLGWEAGALWIREDGGAVTPLGAWPEGSEPVPGEAAAARVWETGEAWCGGDTPSLAYPVRAAGVTVAVAALGGPGPQASCTEARAVLADVAPQIAAFLERARVYREVRQRAEEFATLLDVVPTGVFMARDPECRRVWVNPGFAALMGVPPGANVSPGAPAGERPPFRVFRHGQLLAPEELPMQVAATTGKEVRNAELDMVFDDGRVLHLFGCAAPLRDAAGRTTGSVGAFIDVTERKRLEERFREAQKRESLAAMASGLAHDFNNLLTSVIGNVSLAQGALPEGSWARHYLDESLDAAHRAAALTAQMLAYAGKGRFVVRTVDLADLVSRMWPQAQAAVPPLVELRLELTGEPPLIAADPGQIEQLFMNLLRNAVEAIGEGQGGTITVATGAEEIAQPEHGLAPGRYATLEVRDTGCGMDEATQARIFDPFYTTKFVGRGLGLAAASGIVRGHHGTLRVTSEPGRGSTFRVLFPVLAGA